MFYKIPSGEYWGEYIDAHPSAQFIFISFISLLSAFVVLKLIPIIIKISVFRKLSTPINSRSSHITPVPSLGGVAIFAAVMIALGVSGILFYNTLSYWVLMSMLVIFGVGLKDDLLASSASLKFYGQLLAVLIFVFNPEFHINSLEGMFGIDNVNWLSLIPFIVFFLLSIINGVNLSDGIDGWAASLGIVISSVFSYFFWKAHELFFLGVSISLISALIIFLFFNFSKGKLKIFLGDSGSLLIGLMLSIFSIKFLTLPEAATLSIFKGLFTKINFLLYLFMIPFFDVTRVIIIRILQKRNPFSADRNHIHHILLDTYGSHKKVTFYLVISNITAIVLFLFLNQFLPSTVMLIIYIVLYLLIFKSVSRMKNNLNKEMANRL